MNYYEHPYISRSDLFTLKNKLCPRRFDIDSTNAYSFGNIVDAILTEPQKINQYRGTYEGRKMSSKEIETMKRMRDSFYRDKYCRDLITNSDGQKEMYRELMEFDHCGIPFKASVKCKWDIWKQIIRLGGDIKTTIATSQEQFNKAFVFFGYPEQRAMYMDIADSEIDVVIGISKVKPYQIFKIFINRESQYYIQGKKNYTELLYKFVKIYGTQKPESLLTK